jgi:hypothetical protein
VFYRHLQNAAFTSYPPILGRIFGYGTLVIVGTGGTNEPFKAVAKPMDFRKHFNEAVDSLP